MQTLADHFVSSIAVAFVSSLWQGLVIVCALSIFLKLVPRLSAGSRFAVWAAGLLMTAGLTVFPLLASLAGRYEGLATATTAESGPLLRLDFRWSAVIAGLWVVAALYRAVDLAIHAFRLRRLWRSAEPIEISEKLAGMIVLQGRAQVQICRTAVLERPGVIGFLAPCVLIPEWLLNRLTAPELEQVVLHEVEHLRRRDDWTNLAQKLLMVIFPLNPALWWMERMLSREREMACDEGVVRVTRAPRAYAACLASLAERGLEQRAEALSLGAWQRRSELVQRIHGILLRKQTLRPLASATLLGALGCGFAAGSLELARCPQLVAFVPSQNHSATANNNVVAASTQGDAVFHDRRNLAPGFHVVEAKAEMPGSRVAGTAAANAQPHGGTSRPRPDASTKPGSTAVAKPEKPGASIFDEQQQWVLFTSVERVGVANPRGQLATDYDAAVSGDSTIGDPASNDEWKSQMRITRLILRILPPNSFPAQPDPASFRSGWFVIQL
jgi:beta-lactamase regulating signal transducer with metallopeptidase domain